MVQVPRARSPRFYDIPIARVAAHHKRSETLLSTIRGWVSRFCCRLGLTFCDKSSIPKVIMKFALLSALPVAFAVPASFNPRETSEQITDRYLFSTPLPTFLQFRAQQTPKNLDWSSDGCTFSPDNPFKFPFEPACERHDFGYRNFKAQNRFDSAGRARVDSNFKKE